MRSVRPESSGPRHDPLDEILRWGLITTLFQPVVELDTGGRRRLRGPQPRPGRRAAAAGPALRRRPRCAAGSPSSTSCAGAPPWPAPSTAGIFAPSTLFVNVEPEVLETDPPRRPGGTGRAGAGRAADRPGDHRAGHRGPAGRPAGHRAAAARGRLAHRARRRRRRRHVAGLHAAAAARRRQARPAPGAAAPRAGRRRDHERGQRLRRAHRRRAAGRGHRGRGSTSRWPVPSAPGWARAGCSAAPRPPRPRRCRGGELHLPRAAGTAEPPPSPFALRAGRRAAADLDEAAARRGQQAPRARGHALRPHLRRAVDLPGGAALHAAHRRALPRPGRPGRLRRRDRRGAAAPSRCPACGAPTCSADDPVRGEWDLVVLAPHFAGALLARDLGDAAPTTSAASSSR